MQSKFILPLVLTSLVATLGFTAYWEYSQNRTHELVIATGSPDGEYHAFAEALAAVVAQHEPQIKISVLPTAGAPENMSLIGQNKVQLAIVQSDTTATPPARAVAYLFPEVFHLVARPGSGIQSVADLKGKRVALMPEGSGSYKLFWDLSEHYNLNQAKFTPLPMSPDQAYAALRQGQVDALFRVLALGNPQMETLLKTTQSQLVSIDQVKSLQLSYPFLEATEIPKGTYDGGSPIPSENLPVVGVRAVLIANEQVDAEVVQEITRTLFEFRSEIVNRYPRAALIRLPEAGENLGLPLHDGAKTYYNRERPVFVVEYADSIALFLTIVGICASGLWQLHVWLAGRQKNRADFYNQELLDLIQRMEESQDLKELENIRQQLFNILRQVVTDLDKDRITPESFQSFTFPWEVAITSLRHREMLARQSTSAPQASAATQAFQTPLPSEDKLNRVADVRDESDHEQDAHKI